MIALGYVCVLVLALGAAVKVAAHVGLLDFLLVVADAALAPARETER